MLSLLLRSRPVTCNTLRHLSSLTEDQCILVDREDTPIGRIGKQECHLWEPISKGENLHRAFSVFLFDDKHRMLIHKRSSSKLTFPGVWTNACCSHPLYSPYEMEPARTKGVKRAAIRKLSQELGIPEDSLTLSRLQYMTRMIYKARSNPENSPYGEHELDYLIVLLMKQDEIEAIQPNAKEIEEIKLLKADELSTSLQDQSSNFSPWFRLVAEKFLFSWWKTLNDLTSAVDHEVIHDFRE